MTRVCVVGRRRKGRGIRRLVRQVTRTLASEGWEVRAKVVKRKREVRRAAARAARAGCDVVVAVGGDGTVVRAAGALASTPVALGIVPAGTGNLLAENLGIGHDRARATRILLDGGRRSIDLGRLKVDGVERDFAVACGVGFDARVLKRSRAREKRRWGRLAYLANAVAESPTIRNVPHEITLDGVTSTTDAAQVFIANFGRILPGIEPRRPIGGDDGVLDVIVIRASGPLPGLVAGWEALRQKRLGKSSAGHVFRAQAREVRVATDPARLVEIDGNVVGRTPVTARVLPRALTVVVPRAD